MNSHPKYGEMKVGSKRGNGYYRSRCRNSRLKALYGIQKGYLHTTVYFSEEKQCLMEGPVLQFKIGKYAKKHQQSKNKALCQNSQLRRI